MRILFLVTVDWFFLSHRLHLAKALLAAGHEVHVATAPGDRVKEIESLGFFHHPVGFCRRGTNPVAELQTVRNVMRVIAAVQPQIVHSISLKPALIGSLATALAGKLPHVATLTGLGFVFIGQTLRVRLLRAVVERLLRPLLSRKGSMVIFQNTDDAALFISRGIVPQQQSKIILGSGLDTSRFASSPEPETSHPVVLFPARLLRDKGLGELVQAARMLRDRGYKFRLLLAGDVDAQNPATFSRTEVESWVAEGIVEWLGHSQDMPRLYADASIVALPSYREGLPLALAEAASCGRAIVTSDVPGCREVVVPGQTGLLVPPRDSSALANALAQLLDDAPARARMGERGAARARERYAKEVVIEQTLAVYESMFAHAR